MGARAVCSAYIIYILKIYTQFEFNINSIVLLYELFAMLEQYTIE